MSCKVAPDFVKCWNPPTLRAARSQNISKTSTAQFLQFHPCLLRSDSQVSSHDGILNMIPTLVSCSPPARWGLLDFMLVARLLLPSPSFFSFLLPSPSSSFFRAGPPLPALDRSWASPDLICQLLIAVSLAGCHLPALDRSGARRTSTGEGRSAVGLAGLQPARVWALWGSPDFNWRGSARWASPDFNRAGSERCGPRQTSTGQGRSAVGLAGLQLARVGALGLAGLQPARVGALWASPDFNRPGSERCWPCRTSTGEGLSAVGLAGLQPARVGAPGASPDFNRRDSARCGPRRTLTGPQRPETKPYRMSKRMPDRMSEDMPDRMSEDMPDRMPKDMPDRMPEDLSDRTSEDLPDRMSEDMTDRMSEDMPDRMSEDMPDGMPEDMPDRQAR